MISLQVLANSSIYKQQPWVQRKEERRERIRVSTKPTQIQKRKWAGEERNGYCLRQILLYPSHPFLVPFILCGRNRRYHILLMFDNKLFGIPLMEVLFISSLRSTYSPASLVEVGYSRATQCLGRRSKPIAVIMLFLFKIQPARLSAHCINRQLSVLSKKGWITLHYSINKSPNGSAFPSSNDKRNHAKAGI